MANALVWSVKLCYDPNLRPEATARPGWQECEILVGDKFFKLSPRLRKWVIAHETGHTFEEQIKNLEAALCGSTASSLGKMVDSGKRLHYEGVFGEYRPSEAFATCVAEMYYSPAKFKKRYPEAYDFIKNTLPANWKDAVRANIAQIPNVIKEYDKHLREKHPQRKPVPPPIQKPITKLTIEQRKYLAAHKKMGVGCNRWVEFYQVDIEEAIREAKHLEVQGEQVQIEVTWKDKRPAYTVYMVVCSSPEPTAKTAAKPAPALPPILTAPPELTADVLGGLTPTAAPKHKPATRTTRKQPAKLTAEEIFRLGRDVAAMISKVEGSVLKPTQTEIKNAANAIGVTQAAARVAIEYYNWGHTYPDVPSIKRTTRTPAATPKPAAVPKARKPKKTPAAKPRKTTKKTAKPKTKKTTATPKLTASQQEYLAIQGFVMVKRGGKYVRITG